MTMRNALRAALPPMLGVTTLSSLFDVSVKPLYFHASP
jgi:hypothetical protein